MTSAGALVERLAGIAGRYSDLDRRRKRALLARLARLPVADPRLLLRFHEALCFLQAYPDDRAVLERVEAALAGFAGRVRALPSGRRARLADSGIAGTTLEYPFGLPMARWLVSRFGPDVDVAWEGFEGGERLDEALPLLIAHLEEDALTEGGPGWRWWLEEAKAGRRITTLQLLLELFGRAPLAEDAREALFESVGLTMRWRLPDGWGSRTLSKRPCARPYFHHAGIRRAGLDFRREVLRALPALRRAPRAEASALLESARAALATRLRELHAFSHPNLGDVWLAEPGRGLRLVLIGLEPAHRLPLEAYYAYLALKNGVPVSYGGSWGVHGTLEFAMNIFPSFRQGESAWLTSQILRAYRQLLGFRGLVVERSQVGHDNLEALRSGAFYFYYRLGFRPRDPAALSLAQEEREKIARDPSYRSSLAVLRRLTRNDLFLDLDGLPAPGIRPSAIATLVTRYIAREWGGDREAALDAAESRAGRLLEAPRRGSWPAAEQRSFRRLSLLAALIPDLAGWSRAERRRLALVFRAKGGRSDVAYYRLLGRHARLRQSLERLSAEGMAAAGKRSGP